MELSFFTMPIHPVGKSISQSLQEDREAFILADELGFVDGYCGEHTTDLAEVIEGMQSSNRKRHLGYISDALARLSNSTTYNVFVQK